MSICLHIMRERFNFVKNSRLMKNLLLGLILFSFATNASFAVEPVSNTLPMFETEIQASNDVTISVITNKLRIQNAMGETLEIYSVTGAKLATYKIDCADQYIDLNLGKGCYIVKVKNVARKISINR